jgi:S-formylglutathione hydrolase FrmB
MNQLANWTDSIRSLPVRKTRADRGVGVEHGRPRHSTQIIRAIFLTVLSLCLVGVTATSAAAQQTISVGSPTIDANGVKSYPVTSAYQGSQQQTIRVLEPTNPVSGKPRRLLYVLPVEAGVTNLSSTWSDGLEELRLLNVPNRFNMTLIAPSFNYEPWYGDNVNDPTARMESFIIQDLIPFGDRFAQSSATPQRFLIGFSKSGNGVLFLILRHPDVFTAAAAWDSPAQLDDLSAFSALPMNFGTQANFNLYNIPALVLSNGQPFKLKNRLWISGDQADWTADMDLLHEQLSAASIPHTWVQGGVRDHSWDSGWLDGAVTALDAYGAPIRTGGQPSGTLASGTSQTSLSLTTDENATCRYALTAGVAYSAMTNTFSSTGGTTHATPVTGLMVASYNYYVRCQDTSGNADPDDYVIGFSVGAASGGGTTTLSSNFAGIENPLSESGTWGGAGAWGVLQKNNGAYATGMTSGEQILSPVGPNQYAEITYDQDPGTASWPGVMTRVQGASNGSGYLAIAYAGEVRLYRTDDNGSLNFVQLASATATVGTAPRRLRLESQGANHQIYFNGVLMLSFTDSTYTTGQPGIADAIFGGPTVRILTFAGGALP